MGERYWYQNKINECGETPGGSVNMLVFIYTCILDGNITADPEGRSILKTHKIIRCFPVLGKEPSLWRVRDPLGQDLLSTSSTSGL